MKVFEHEVLNFKVDNRKNYEAMQKALREWGAAGYELVSVAPDRTSPQAFIVFLKREIGSHDPSSEEAA